MCVQAKGFAWERPAVAADIPILSARFASVDFDSMLTAMSVCGFVPLTADLVLLGAALDRLRMNPVYGIYRSSVSTAHGRCS